MLTVVSSLIGILCKNVNSTEHKARRAAHTVRIEHLLACTAVNELESGYLAVHGR
jgi:hypothetical protein